MNKEAYDYLFQNTLGYLVSQSIFVAAKLRVADHLADGPMAISDLAVKTEVNESYLYRIMRLLANQKIFVEEEGQKFSNNDSSHYLRSDVTDTFRDFAILINNTSCPYPASGKIMDCMASGEIPFDNHYGMPVFDYIKENQDMATLLDAAMHSAHTGGSRAFLKTYDLSDAKVVADVGGGAGEATTSMLNHYPELKSVIFDLPHVIERTTKRFEENGLIDRCEMVGGSFFEDVPVKADTYFMRQVLHDWTDEQCITILKNIRKNAEKGARLLVCDCIVKERGIGENSQFYDLLMLYITGGHERTEAEFKKIFEASGFEFVSVTPNDFWFWTLEAKAV